MYNKKKTINIDKSKIWHPFTQMKDYENTFHIPIIKGKGIKLYDMDGKQYYDTISSWWTNILGHNNKYISRAVKKQLDRIEHVNFSGFTHPYAAECIDRLSAFLPESLSKFFFSDNGSTSVEVAIKMAFQYHQNTGQKEKTKFVMLEHAYHGDTMGAVSVGGVDTYHKLYKPLMFKTFQAKAPVCVDCTQRRSEYTFDAENTGCGFECFNSIENIIKKNHKTIAAIIIEPLILAAGGMFVYPAEYLIRLRKIASKYSIFLIFDEVAVGFGRTGKMFALEKAGVIPDILCLSKGITAGYMPLAVTVSTKKIYNAFYDDYMSQKTFFHGHSYTGNPLACSASIACLKYLKKYNLPYSRQTVINHFHSELKKLIKYDFVKDIRFIGFIGAIDIIKSRKHNKKFAEEKRIGLKIYQKSLKEGLVLRPLGDTIYWFLPLIITKKQIDKIIKKSISVVKYVINDCQ